MPEFSLLVGPDDLLAEAVLMGAHGGMAGGSNVWPRLFVALYEAAVAHDVNRVAALHQQAMQFDNAVYRSAEHAANPLRGLKCAFSLLGICGTGLTPPLRPYSSAERDRVQQYLRGVDVLSVPQLSSATLSGSQFSAVEGSKSKGKNWPSIFSPLGIGGTPANNASSAADRTPSLKALINVARRGRSERLA